MPVNLSKGGNLNLTKAAPGLAAVTVGLGWDARTTDGQPFDLDASVVVCNDGGKVVGDGFFVFFNNLKTPDGSVEHLGDNLSGVGDGDDEVVKVDLAGMQAAAVKVVFAVSIHEADARAQSFGQVRNAYIRVTDPSSGSELARYDLTEDASMETAMIFGELYRAGSE